MPLEPCTPRFAVDDEVVLSYGGGDPTDGHVLPARRLPAGRAARAARRACSRSAVLVLGRWQGLKALGALVLSFVGAGAVRAARDHRRGEPAAWSRSSARA